MSALKEIIDLFCDDKQRLCKLNIILHDKQYSATLSEYE